MIIFGINIDFVNVAMNITIAGGFIALQLYFFCKTWRDNSSFKNFFKRKGKYAIEENIFSSGSIRQIVDVGYSDSDLSKLIQEVNYYAKKTKGTTDFAVIQNKVERKLNMRLDQSTVHLSFPTYLGLMGTFAGVFTGILTFVFSIDNQGNFHDDAIQNLLSGVLVSMITSLTGLILTTWNTARSGEARKLIEEEKNSFYDFAQTEFMPQLNSGMVAAIIKLHEVVDRFEPSFNRVIDNFSQTFDRCTKAFGTDFEKNVKAVAGAVDVMGRNMDKINENISIQNKLIDAMKSEDLAKGMERYIEASNNFVGITQSLNKFEEARRMMLAAAQETIVLQNQLAESLKIPREVAIRINQILERVTTFEKSINELGSNLNQRDMLGNDVLNTIKDQLHGISKKGQIADRYLEMADGKLEDLFEKQTKVIGEMNTKYQEALNAHIAGFEKMIEDGATDLKKRHQEFLNAMEENLSIENIRQEFTSLRHLEPIEGAVTSMKDTELEAFGSLELSIKKIVEFATVMEKIVKEQESIKRNLEGMQKDTKDQLEIIKKNTATVKIGSLSLFGK